MTGPNRLNPRLSTRDPESDIDAAEEGARPALPLGIFPSALCMNRAGDQWSGA